MNIRDARSFTTARIFLLYVSLLLWQNSSMSRWVKFLVALAVGIAAGLIYAWVLNPTEYKNTSPVTLKAEYRTDYVLMVAEVYTFEQDLDLAGQRLASLGSQPPAQMTAQALEYAIQDNFTPGDLVKLDNLLTTLQIWQASP